MKLLIGNFKGPKGEQGNEGKKGDNGDKGEKGERGSRWTSGTAITGTSTTETIFADSGITDAKIDDYYINTTTGNLYQCTASGAADTAKWVYIGNFKGPKGNDGPAGSISDINDQIPTYEESTQFENIESGETVKIAFGKLKKALSVFIVHHTQKATAAILGHVKLSNSAAITKAGEYALDAIEKNAAIEGTLANLINSLNSNMACKKIEVESNFASEIKVWRIGNVVSVDIDGYIIAPVNTIFATGFPIPIFVIWVQDLAGHHFRLYNGNLKCNMELNGKEYTNLHFTYLCV